MTTISTLKLTSAATGPTTHVFWERLWRMSGINFVIFFLAAYVIYGLQPHVGASNAEIVAFYDGDRTRILIAAVFAGMSVLNLLWFAAALRATLADEEQDGWGAAVTASSAMLGGLFILLITVSAALAHAISADHTFAAGLNGLLWSGTVMTSFPRAMFIMAGTFGLWRAKLFSNGLFAAGVAAVVLVLLGGTTWLSGGFWAPDGAYSRFVSPIVGLLWVLVVSRVLLLRYSTRTGW